MPEVYLGLGSNLQQPEKQIQKAIKTLKNHPDIQLMSVASIYKSPALGNDSHPDYLNTVVRIQTELTPPSLLKQTQTIENEQGRVRTPGIRWEPRTIDLDILLYGNEQITSPQLTIPHPEMLNRNFVMLPLLEIAPEETEIAGVGRLELLANVWQAEKLEKVPEK